MLTIFRYTDFTRPFPSNNGWLVPYREGEWHVDAGIGAELTMQEIARSDPLSEPDLGKICALRVGE